MPTTTTVEELDTNDLNELGITPLSDFHAAYRVNADTINVVVDDQDGGVYIDDPSVDHSGEDAWQWIGFDNGHDRNAYIEEHPEHHPDSFAAIPPGERTFCWIERYEHSLVRYAPIGESSVLDRQWDVAVGVAVIVFDREKWPDVDVMTSARGICEEYTAWCNGDVYGIVTYTRRPAVDAPNLPMLIPDEYANDQWVKADTSWGYIGAEYAETTAKENSL